MSCGPDFDDNPFGPNITPAPTPTPTPTPTPPTQIAWTPTEATFIAEVNDLIDQISQPLLPNELNTKFFSTGTSSSTQARVVLLGENHVDVPSLLEQARALQSLVKAGDVILFEGADAGKAADCIDPLSQLWSAGKWSKTGQIYTGTSLQPFDARFNALMNITVSALNLSKINFAKATCLYWDNSAAFLLEPWLLSLQTRNTAMTEEIQRNLSLIFGTIFIKAGKNHLPSGELDSFKDFFTNSTDTEPFYNLMPDDLQKLTIPQFYQTLSKSTNADAIAIQKLLGYGATEPIYDFITNQAYVELIPLSLIKGTDPCGTQCN